MPDAPPPSAAGVVAALRQHGALDRLRKSLEARVGAAPDGAVEAAAAAFVQREATPADASAVLALLSRAQRAVLTPALEASVRRRVAAAVADNVEWLRGVIGEEMGALQATRGGAEAAPEGVGKVVGGREALWKSLQAGMGERAKVGKAKRDRVGKGSGKGRGGGTLGATGRSVKRSEGERGPVAAGREAAVEKVTGNLSSKAGIRPPPPKEKVAERLSRRDDAKRGSIVGAENGRDAATVKEDVAATDVINENPSYPAPEHQEASAEKPASPPGQIAATRKHASPTEQITPVGKSASLKENKAASRESVSSAEQTAVVMKSTSPAEQKATVGNSASLVGQEAAVSRAASSAEHEATTRKPASPTEQKAVAEKPASPPEQKMAARKPTFPAEQKAAAGMPAAGKPPASRSSAAVVVERKFPSEPPLAQKQRLVATKSRSPIAQPPITGKPLSPTRQPPATGKSPAPPTKNSVLTTALLPVEKGSQPVDKTSNASGNHAPKGNSNHVTEAGSSPRVKEDKSRPDSASITKELSVPQKGMSMNADACDSDPVDDSRVSRDAVVPVVGASSPDLSPKDFGDSGEGSNVETEKLEMKTKTGELHEMHKTVVGKQKRLPQPEEMDDKILIDVVPPKDAASSLDHGNATKRKKEKKMKKETKNKKEKKKSKTKKRRRENPNDIESHPSGEVEARGSDAESAKLHAGASDTLLAKGEPGVPADYEDQQRIIQALKELVTRDYAEPFAEPVNPRDEGCSNYYDVIKNPMDLGTIIGRVENASREPVGYRSTAEIFEDVDLIWSNCRLFNGDFDAICYLADKCSSELIMLCEKYGVRKAGPRVKGRKSRGKSLTPQPTAKRPAESAPKRKKPKALSEDPNDGRLVGKTLVIFTSHGSKKAWFDARIEDFDKRSKTYSLIWTETDEYTEIATFGLGHLYPVYRICS